RYEQADAGNEHERFEGALGAVLPHPDCFRVSTLPTSIFLQQTDSELPRPPQDVGASVAVPDADQRWSETARSCSPYRPLAPSPQLPALPPGRGVNWSALAAR